MKPYRKGLALLIVQLILVLSVAGKYLYERKTRPRVWARAAQYDPNEPLRGRYLALQLLVDACSLPRDKAHELAIFVDSRRNQPRHWSWSVSLGVTNGHLQPHLEERPRSRENIEEVTFWENEPCDRAPVSATEEYFVPDVARTPFPLQPGQELWVEVTVPPSGPPRPIQLALSSEAGFKPLKFE